MFYHKTQKKFLPNVLSVIRFEKWNRNINEWKTDLMSWKSQGFQNSSRYGRAIFWIGNGHEASNSSSYEPKKLSYTNRAKMGRKIGGETLNIIESRI